MLKRFLIKIILYFNLLRDCRSGSTEEIQTSIHIHSNMIQTMNDFLNLKEELHKLTDPINLKRYKGNLLDSDAQYIAHQCNCITMHAAGLAKVLFEKYPWANTYITKHRSGVYSTLGTIDIKGLGVQRKVINMYAQYFPGSINSVNASEGSIDSESIRISAFIKCLAAISLIPDLRSIAFPHLIGCGIAGGDWAIYNSLLIRFAESNPEVTVYIVQL